MPRIVLPATRFQRNSISLLALLISDLEDKIEEGLDIDLKNLNLAYIYIKESKADDLINNFIPNTYDHWETIFEKDEGYFLENAEFLAPQRFKKKLKPYIDVLRKENGKIDLPKAQKDELWLYIHNMIKCCIYYLHDKPKGMTAETKETLAKIKLDEITQKWTVDPKRKVYESSDEEDSSNDDDEESSGDEESS